MDRYWNRYILRITILLTAFFVGGSAMAQVTVNGSVYGGGNLADVGGSVTVNMRTGTVAKDVYGGGALANTNTNNWNFEGEGYEVVSVTADVTVVTGLYIESNGVYTEITDENQKADEHTVYYQKIGTWASGMYNTTTGATTYTTEVNLIGGTINGDAYGGGLGQLGNNPVAAMVYGNVFLNLGNETEDEDKRSATAFKITYADTGDKDEDNNPIKVVNSGRVFGCNNLNGSPKGSVTVTVNKTVTGKDANGNDLVRTDITRDSQTKKVTSVATPHVYEVAAVYGGGNLANYVPKDGVVKVIINSCDVSVEQVYGGGNAAEVPSTDVLVKGAHEIEQVFGGGNGKDKYYLNNQWNENSGANVNGNANTLIKGGLVHEAYGGSNERGTITGNVTIDTGTGDLAACPPQVDKLVGAGKNADVNGNLIMILGCKDATKIPIVYGGADNANLNGNVELTITSGHFGQVFGGNNLGGVIRGHIYLNIEETSECEPITIDDLYLGGNQAAYSRYGYYVQTTAMEGENATGEGLPEETPVLTNDKLTFLPRTSATDSRKPVKTYDMAEKRWTVYAGTTEDPYPEYEEPVLNVISCTSIGRVFGGGLGEGAAMYADPTVNINMIPGYHATNNGLGEIGVGYTYTDETTSETVTVEGGVFGGGNQAAIIGNTTVNIGTETSVYVKSWTYNAETKKYTGAPQTVQGANIKSNVYGGGNQANVTGNTFVNICAKKGSGNSYAPVAEGTQKVTIGGNVFGGGKGIADNFYCNKAMVGEDGKGSPDNLGTNYHDGNTSVIIGNGTVNGNVYGGGEVGRVEMNTTVTVGLPGEETSSPDIKGDVFGGGMGEKEHGYAGLVRGNPTVTIQANAKVEHSVYGGGEIASVARYKVPITDEDVTAAHNAGYPDAVKGRPYALKDVNSGFCTVTVQGNAIIGPDTPMKMYHEVNGAIPATDTPDDAGHVFGAGKGFMPENYDYDADEVGHKPRCRANDNSWTWFDDVDEYIAFIQTQALSSQTTVTIGDADDSNSKPFIKGSVYGGSENGLVQFNTHVYIIGGQIGCGKNANGQPHPDAIWDPDFEPDGTEDYECASWAYGKEEGSGDDKTTVYAPYDPFANASGNVDKYPKVPSQSEAKSTEGGRKVASDGHTYYGNVFGGGSGSVPYFDTKEGISKYLHSAGTVKGNTNVTISGGHILTSVYGGCEATNVMETANVTMTGGTIGVPRTDTQILAHPVTCNLYGAGKGDQRVFFNKDTNVNDAVVEVSGGRIYGSVFGGGEDGHIMRNSTVTISGADTKIGTKGTSYMDGNVFGGGRGFGGDALTAGNVGGAVTLNIENGYVLGSVYGGGRLASVGYGLYLTTEEGYGVMRADNEYDGSYTNPSTEAASTFFNKGRGKITINISGGTIGNDVANAEYGGNVFGGSMGSLTKQDGTINTQWDKFATAKMTTVNITGGTIKRSVYGGGELGTVTTDAIVTVSGGTIGKPKDGTTVYGGAVYGNVYGGGKGYVDPDGSNYITAGIIKGNTYVTIENGSITVGETPTTTTPTIYHNIYGGGAYGSVGEFTYDGTTGMPTARTSGGTANITITGGTIGTDGQNNGMVFGSSRGDVGAPGEIHDKLAWVYDTHVTIGETSGSTSTPLIKGSVYGSGENGHTFNDAEVVVHSGTIGIASGDDVGTYKAYNYPYRGNVYGGGCGTDKYYIDPTSAANPYDGNGELYNHLAGIVYGKTTVTVDGGHVVHNVYGAGAMGSVGKIANYDDLEDETKGYKHDSTKDDGAFYGFGLSWPYEFTYDDTTDSDVGQTSVTITGNAIIGVTNSDATGGHVYGAARGAVDVGQTGITDQRYVEAKLANVRKADVIIGTSGVASDTTTPTIHGSVYGGGEDGHVYDDASVTIHHGTIAHSVFGGGKGESTFTTTLWDPDKANETDKDKESPESVHSWIAGKVYGNTSVTMNGGSVGYSIYGGGNLASVGKGNYAGGTDDYSIDGYGELPPSSSQTLWDNTNFTGSGIATVTINAGIVGSANKDYQGLPTGNVFGSSRGRAAMSVGQLSPRYRYVPDFFLGYVNKTIITIGGDTPSNAANAEPIIHGSVYGGGQDGHVRNSTYVIINKGTIGSANGGAERGNVFGSGSGLGQYTKGSDLYYNNSSGSVTCTTQVDINGGKIFQNVYGGGALSSVGPPFTGQAIGIETNAATESKASYSYTQVNINGGTIGSEGSDYGGNVYGASRGDVTLEYQGEDLNTYATDLWSTVNIGETNSSVPTVIWGNVFGGGENGQVKGSVTVTMTGGEVKKDVYGGGALAHTNTSNWVYNRQTATTAGSWGDTWADNMTTTVNGKIATKYNTHVSLTGGHIYGDAYGGALGQSNSSMATNDGIPAYVFGDVKVELNNNNNGGNADGNQTGCIVNRVFGCNNLNGTPKGHVQVYVYATQKNGENLKLSDKTVGSYDVQAVYGGGNLSPYVPADALLNYSVEANKARVEAARSEVYIDGCSLTSIRQVYGGGNAASAPATFVQVNRCYEIDEVFGGGNGADDYSIKEGANTVWYKNPGANVGYYNYSIYPSPNAGGGSQSNPYQTTDDPDYDTKEERVNATSLHYGSGIARTEIKGGTVHTVFGGSNSKGNIRTKASSAISSMFDDCPMSVGKSYGAGKNADIDGEVEVEADCAKGVEVMFGGAENADVDNNINLTITNGSSLKRVFGGNNTSGAINGTITVNIQEGGCEPIVIEELYAGGYLAPYSVYGYETNGDGTYKTETEPLLDDDGNPLVDTNNNPIYSRIPIKNGSNPRKDPRINVISATRIDNIYGGGYKAALVGNPHINVNMEPGRIISGYVKNTVEEPFVGSHTTDNGYTYVGKAIDETTGDGILEIGTIGNIFGGGNEADIIGNTYVEIGTGRWLNSSDVWETGTRKAAVITSIKENGTVTREGGYVYGGGNKGDVTGNTYVNICAYEDDNATTTDVIEYKGVPLSGTGNEVVSIEGDVFGGGKGIADSFTCAKGMVGEVNTNNGSIDIMHEVTDDGTSKGTRVSIGNGTIEGTVYGGGEVGRVEWNGVVTIGLPVGENETSSPVIGGNVFGGGKGVEQYGYAALMRGNTFVTVQANAKVGKSVYGGGEIASVGKYNIVKESDLTDEFKEAHPGLEVGMPWSLGNEGSGYCNVIVRGNAEIGPDNMKMYNTETGKPDDEGHVFGAGKGVLPYENEDDFECQIEGHNKGKHPGRMSKDDVWECYEGQETKYLKFIETQALATHTEVLVGGNAFVKGSVYGGSLSGHVQHDTHVTIAGDCQIGAGFDTSTEKSLPKYTNWPTETQGLTESWAECAHWRYDTNNDMPYDPYAIHYNSADGKYYYDEEHTLSSNGGSNIATDGHTYYGNVFGGGSGVVPYRPGKWHREAGTVGGNTVVDITGGHILTSVYGGNEHTDVGTYDNTNYRNLLAGTGKCTINMIGGTVGVPRTKADIVLHPLTCYVFGAGKGDSRTDFNEWTNVGETEVNISGNARIYGSTFGGGEDGHVLGDAETNIGDDVTIGSITHYYPTTIDGDNPGVIIGSQGQSGADGNVFGGGRGFREDALTAGVVCGDVTVNIHNGKMLGTVYGGGRLASVGTHLAGAGTTLYGKLIPDGKNQVIGSTDVDATGATHGHIAINIDGGIIGATGTDGKLVVSDYSVGDVFGGSKGVGSDKRFGLAKNTIITMTGGTVNGNVYGGGELGYVGEATLNSSNVYVWNEEAAGGGLCTIGISGGMVKGHVFGAGKGLADDFDCEKALVRTTNVTISKSGTTGTTVSGNVYGGGEIGRVDQNTVVTIGNSASDGAGTEEGTDAVISGDVFGAGAGVETHGYSALVRGNATVTIQGNASVGHNVYGGGMIASVGQYGLDSNFMPETLKGGGDCKVTVKGYAVIGSSGEGHVFGAGMGINPFDGAHNFNYTNNPDDSNNKKTKPKRMTKRPAADKMPALWDPVGDGSEYIWEYYTSQDNYFKFLQTLALVTDSYATIEGNASVHGNVYGGSESGFVQRETDVKIQGSCKILTVTDTENNTTTDGNVFGGGKGVPGFDKAGRVRGNATTTIGESSTVHGNVYGGGELGFVGKFEKGTDDYGTIYIWPVIETQTEGQTQTTGLCTVEINSATAEVKGHVFGAGKGKDDTFECEQAMSRTTSVTISAGTVGGNVYGGGEVGRVDQDTEVTIGDGTGNGAGSATGIDAPVIAGSVFGAGAGLETHGYSALVRGNATVTIQGNANVGQNVYGGGQIASVGRYALDKFQMPSLLVAGGICTVDVKGWTKIGTSTEGGNVFGACRGVTPDYKYGSGYDKKDWSKRMMKYSAGFVTGKVEHTDWDYCDNPTYIWDYMTSEADYLSYLETLALATEPRVTISGNTNINGDVYGGGERGLTKGSVTVNILGGTIANDVYGGGALANTNISNWTKYGGDTEDVSDDLWNWTDNTNKTAKYTTTVNLHGGTIGHNVYGGGLGQKHKEAVAAVAAQGTEGQEDYVPAVEAQDEVPAIAALVYGDVLVKLNEKPTVTEGVANFPDNCVVKGVIHGANNYNGSPLGDVTVHVYKTVARDDVNKKSTDKDDTTYDLKAVYGGGNEAAYDTEGYYPFTDATNAKREAHVIIEGCDLTSIQTVYGGGNAAAAPATHVEVNSCYEIGTVFAGGNGKDAMNDGSENPGADVGYKPNAAGTGKVSYGTGEALAEIHGGFVHSAFGGSNTKGNVRESATVQLSEFDTSDPRYCPLGIDEAYGAGNEAEQDGTSNIDLGCLSYLRELYGGAKNADVNNDIVLNVQSGRFHRVFGGNNIGGRINGTITVNVEETGCHPIIIGQLFGGGNQAGYSVYGYKPELKGDGTIKTDANGKTCWLPFKKNDAAVTVEGVTYSPKTETTKFNDPVVNVRSFTSIGEIYGGGYGNSAVIVGNPTVDINECLGSHADDAATDNYIDQEGHPVMENNQPVKVSENTGKWIHIKVGASEYNTVWQPEHKEGAIGTIGNVFGGGNAAPVDGNTNVYIGTKESVVFATPKKKTVTTNDVTTEVDTTVEDRTHTVKGANITGNVYGGGNAADVSGDTNVVIGKETTTTSGGNGGSGGN